MLCRFVKHTVITYSTIYLSLGNEARLMTLNEAFLNGTVTAGESSQKALNVRTFPYLTTLRWVYENPRVIKPGFNLSLEILKSYLFNVKPDKFE